jgi:hypothetical protein
LTHVEGSFVGRRSTGSEILLDYYRPRLGITMKRNAGLGRATRSLNEVLRAHTSAINARPSKGNSHFSGPTIYWVRIILVSQGYSTAVERENAAEQSKTSVSQPAATIAYSAVFVSTIIRTFFPMRPAFAN